MKRKGAGYHHGDLRRALVEATSKLVDKRGPDEFTLRAAARLAGVSDGAPYHHFEDKEALLAAVSADGFRLLRDEMKTAAEKQRGSPSKKSLAMGVAYVLFAAKRPARFRLMFGPILHSKGRHPELGIAAREAYALVRQALSRGVGGETTRNEPPHAALSGWALIHGLAVLSIDGHIEVAPGPELEQMAWRALELVSANVEVPASARKTGAVRAKRARATARK